MKFSKRFVKLPKGIMKLSKRFVKLLKRFMKLSKRFVKLPKRLMKLSTLPPPWSVAHTTIISQLIF